MSINQRIKTIDKLLEKEFGRRIWKSEGNPLSVLISTVLSQNTSDINSHRSFSNLKKVFKNWNEVRRAPVSKIAQAIKSGGLSNIKAKRIKEILNQIPLGNGDLSLSFLKKWNTEKIESYLKSFKGVGEKTIACVLLFSLNRPSMPVDTHIFRISKRLNLIPVDADFKTAHRILSRIILSKKIYQFHINLIAFGRTICKARNPRCEICVLYSICKSKDKKPKTKLEEVYAKN